VRGAWRGIRRNGRIAPCRWQVPAQVGEEF